MSGLATPDPVPSQDTSRRPVAAIRGSLSILQPLQVAAGLAATALGLTVVATWLTNNEALMRLHPLFPPMHYSVAVGLVLCGLALLSWSGGWWRLARVSAVIVLLLGLAALAEFGPGVGWNLSRTMLRGIEGGDAGRMVPANAISFILIGVGIIAVGASGQRGRGSLVCMLCGVTVAAQNGVVFLRYGIEVTGAYGLTGAEMAGHSAAGLAVVGLGTFAAAWSRLPVTAREAPHWLPLPIALGVAMISVSLWQQAESDSQALTQRGTQLYAEQLSAELGRGASAAIDSIVQLAGPATGTGRTPAESRAMAVRALRRSRSQYGIALVGREFRPEWIEARESTRTSQVIAALDDRTRGLLRESAHQRRPRVVEPVDFGQADLGFLVGASVQSDRALDTSVIGLFRYEDFFETTLAAHRNTDYALRVSVGAREVYRVGDVAVRDDRFLGSTQVPALGATWQVKVWPRVPPRGRGVAADSALVLGLMMAGLLGWAVQLGQRSARSADALAEMNANLQSESAERTAAQAARDESEVRYRQIVDAADDIIYRTDSEGHFTLVNPAASKIMGWSREELIGRNYLTLIRPDYQAAARAFYWKQLEERTPSTYYDFPAITADGQEVWIGQHVQLLIDHGQVVGCQAVARDISARIRVQQELQRMRDAALETARFKSEFVANTSHEIRTPLNGILGFSNLLLDTDLSDEQRQYADGLRLSADSLLTIVNDILDFSKIEAGMLRLEIVRFDLRTIVDNTIVVFAEAAKRKRVTLELSVADDVPQRVKGDPGRFRQVLTNLISNAIKFADDGSVTVTVTNETQTESHNVVRVAVRDTGIGIDADAQGRLFQAFVQADGSTTRRFGGTGLGLAISRQLVDLMGGTINLESAPGKGSTFSFTVKLERDQQSAPLGAVAAPDLRGLRLLVVDDSPSMREELVSYGVALGLRVDDATDGRRALTRLREAAARGEAYDIALLSLAHPDMDGITLARTIKTDPDIAAVKIVLVPVKGVRGQAMEAREAGIAAYLPRPVQLPELLQCLLSLTSHGSNAVGANGPALVTRYTLDEQRGSRAGFRILVTDDNEVSRHVTKLLIEKLGYQVDTAGNGLEAIEAAVRVPYGAILMDCQMPVMDGFAATAEIRRREQGGRRTPIIAFTAGVASRDREECRLAGMDDFLEKPVRKHELVEVLNRWFSRSASPSEQSSTAPESAVSVPLPDELVSGDVLHALQDELGPDVLAQLIERQIEQADASMLVMERAISSDAIEDLQREAHRLKGSSLILGLVRLGALCAWLEDDAGRHTQTERTQVLLQLRTVCADVRRWYEAEHQTQPR